jgi:hypothetical protein
MPVVGRGDLDRINILSQEQVTEIIIRCTVFVFILIVSHDFGLQHAFPVHIANGNHPAVIQLQVGIQVPVYAMVPGPDHTEVNFVIGTTHAGGYYGWQHNYPPGCKPGINQEFSSADFHDYK